MIINTSLTGFVLLIFWFVMLLVFYLLHVHFTKSKMELHSPALAKLTYGVIIIATLAGSIFIVTNRS